MNHQDQAANLTEDTQSLRRVLRTYRTPNRWRSAVEIMITVIPLVALYAAMLVTLNAGYPAGLLLALPAGGLVVRLFMIQHDCSHYAFFRSRRANNWLGRIIGVVTLTPHDLWRHTHRVHHANSGNLDRPPTGGIITLTVTEYEALNRWQRLRYRLYRHPLVLFGLGPIYFFFLHNRLPIGFMRAGWMPWLSTMGTNAAIAVIVGGVIWLTGGVTFLLAYLAIMLVASVIGVWLFYVQHQFEHTSWEKEDVWSFDQAALQGSSHYDLPPILRWFTANIGIHHIHHLCSGIPFYRLSTVLRDYPELHDISRVTLGQSLATVRLALWDENRNRLVPFGQHNL